MPGTVRVPEPGSYRFRGWNRKTPSVWGTLEEQIAEATAANLAAHSGFEHEPMNLWTWVEDCPHKNPEEDSRFEGVDDLLDAKMAELYPGLTYRDGKGYWDRRNHCMSLIPLYVEFHEAMEKWEPDHDGNVCLLSPMGSTCKGDGCMEGDEDSGYEPSPCRRQERAKEAQWEFWDMFTEKEERVK